MISNFEQALIELKIDNMAVDTQACWFADEPQSVFLCINKAPALEVYESRYHPSRLNLLYNIYNPHIKNILEYFEEKNSPAVDYTMTLMIEKCTQLNVLYNSVIASNDEPYWTRVEERILLCPEYFLQAYQLIDKFNFLYRKAS